MAEHNMGSAVLTLDGLEKSFGANKVLKGVSFSLYKGKVTALLGANGAGKSTLIKILAGLYSKSGGSMLIDSKKINIEKPTDAARIGIQIVHQRVDESIVDGLSVAENLCFEEIVSGKIDAFARENKILTRAQEISSTLNLGWDSKFLKKDVLELGIADRQLLLLARALIHKPKILILDEPTSTLSQSEVDRLFDVVKELRERGVAILYVTHRMGEIDELADELVVLRDGTIVDYQKTPFDLAAAIDEMLGNKTGSTETMLKEQRGTDTVLELRDVKVLPRSNPFSLDIRKGEVTGVIGLIGAGKTEIAKGIYGLDQFFEGSMRLHSRDYAPKNPSHAVKSGIYLVPEDRAAEAMLPDWSIGETVSLPFLESVSTGGVIDSSTENARGKQVIDGFSVVCTGPNQAVDDLSGGNQQKVIVGRWMLDKPTLFLLDEPFRGVDIGARRDISSQLRVLASTGVAVVVFSSDVEEIHEVADRVLVLVDGEIELDKYNGEVDFDTIVDTISKVG